MTEKHHNAWLRAHPYVDRAWLKQRIADGFEIHHLDGDHANNRPENLVLIEGGDHKRLHGRKIESFFTSWQSGREGGKKRWANVTPEQRKALMSRAVNMRWSAYRKRKKAERERARANGTP